MQSNLPSKWRLLIWAALVLSACARQGAPSGGPKDTRPPMVDTLHSTRNYSTHFAEKRISLQFDEWVVLNNPNNQVIISPPLAKKPEITLKGKAVILRFDKDEVLRPNTTYTINFGAAIKDFHEGNQAKDLRFVFSTGDFIDSLSFRGIAVDAFTGDPLENISVMLYDNLSDTVVRKDRPYYFAQTDKGGQYEFKNLRSGPFQLAAFEDADLNLRWDGDAEKIAFLDSTLQVIDSLHVLQPLKLFKNTPVFRLTGENANRYGLLRFGFSAPIDSFELKTLAPAGLRTLVEKSRDSVLFWYDLPADTSWALTFTSPEYRMSPKRDSSGFDTLHVRKLSRADFLKNHRVLFADAVAPAVGSSARNRSAGSPPPARSLEAKTLIQLFDRPAGLDFNFPIQAVDTSRWVFKVDTIFSRQFKVAVDSSGPRKWNFHPEWRQGKTYSLTLLPGALTDFWGETNTDTLKRIFNVIPEKQLGTLTIAMDKLKPGAAYVFQLLNGNSVEAERRFQAEADTHKETITHLQVSTYSARLVEDVNRNGRWDSGQFRRRQPEPIFNKKLEALRANWELEATLSATAGAEQKRPKK